MTQGKILFYIGYPLWLVVIGLAWAVHNILFERVSYRDCYYTFKVITKGE